MLILICGMPRAGKTTYSQRYENVIHLDGNGYNKVKDMISNTFGDVVVEGIYHDSRSRTKLIKAYQGHGTRCIWLDTPLEIRKARPKWTPSYGMIFEPPTLDEGWDEIVVIKGDDDVQSYSRQTKNRPTC